MRRMLVFLLPPLALAVIVLCFVFPSSYFRRQDMLRLEAEEILSIDDRQNAAEAELSLFDRLEMARNLGDYYVTEIPASDEDTSKIVEKVTTEIKKFIASPAIVYGISYISYQQFQDSVVQPARHYTVSDPQGRSFSAWELEFSFSEDTDMLYTDMYIKAVYDEQSDKLLQLTVRDNSIDYWGEISDMEYDMVKTLLAMYYGADAEIESESYYLLDVVLEPDKRAERIPVYYSGDMICINYADYLA